VVPSEFGVQRPLYFFLLPAYWREGRKTTTAAATATTTTTTTTSNGGGGAKAGGNGSAVAPSPLLTEVYSENPMAHTATSTSTGKTYPAEHVDRRVVRSQPHHHRVATLPQQPPCNLRLLLFFSAAEQSHSKVSVGVFFPYTTQTHFPELAI